MNRGVLFPFERFCRGATQFQSQQQSHFEKEMSRGLQASWLVRVGAISQEHQREEELLYETGLHQYACPGWSFYKYVSDPKRDKCLQRCWKKATLPTGEPQSGS